MSREVLLDFLQNIGEPAERLINLGKMQMFTHGGPFLTLDCSAHG